MSYGCNLMSEDKISDCIDKYSDSLRDVTPCYFVDKKASKVRIGKLA